MHLPSVNCTLTVVVAHCYVCVNCTLTVVVAHCYVCVNCTLTVVVAHCYVCVNCTLTVVVAHCYVCVNCTLTVVVAHCYVCATSLNNRGKMGQERSVRCRCSVGSRTFQQLMYSSDVKLRLGRSQVTGQMSSKCST